MFSAREIGASRKYGMHSLQVLADFVLPLTIVADSFFVFRHVPTGWRLPSTPPEKVMGENMRRSALLRLRTDSRKKDKDKWITDEVVNAYVRFVSRSGDPAADDVLFLNSFFYRKLMEGFNVAESWVQKAMRQQKKPNFRRVVTPVHMKDEHWFVLAIDFDRQVVVSIDSLQRDHSECRDHFLEWAERWAKGCDGNLLTGRWESKIVKVAQQENGFDCGVFACGNIALWSHGRVLNFSQGDALPFRKNIAFSIINEEPVGCNDDDGETAKAASETTGVSGAWSCVSVYSKKNRTQMPRTLQF